MSTLSEIVPQDQHLVIDLVKAAGADVSDWSNFKGGVEKAASNPKYCYEWSFVEPRKVVVLNLWHASMQERNGVVSQDLNMRTIAHRFGRQGKSVEARRASSMDLAIQTAVREALPVRVIVCEGDMRNLEDANAKASRVHKRLLDPVPWAMFAYDRKSGQCTVVRGALPDLALQEGFAHVGGHIQLTQQVLREILHDGRETSDTDLTEHSVENMARTVYLMAGFLAEREFKYLSSRELQTRIDARFGRRGGVGEFTKFNAVDWFSEQWTESLKPNNSRSTRHFRDEYGELFERAGVNPTNYRIRPRWYEHVVRTLSELNASPNANASDRAPVLVQGHVTTSVPQGASSEPNEGALPEPNEIAAPDPPSKLQMFTIGRSYTRADLRQILGIEGTVGGKVDTGYFEHEGHLIVLSNVGVPGRTGHDYGDKWVGDDLVWRGKTKSHTEQPLIQKMLHHGVHLFTRSDDRQPFVYRGPHRAKAYKSTVPITVTWTLSQTDSAALCSPTTLPEELPDPAVQRYPEGAGKIVVVNVYERNPVARGACLRHYGMTCSVCTFDFHRRYGERGRDFIHVHHIVPLASIGKEYQVDPIADLRPVCPNCHAMLHRTNPPCSIEELRGMLS